MPDYMEYQKSVVVEFRAYEKRVRNLIGDVHRGEEGHYKEVILMNYLKRILPQNISVGTGFVRSNNNVTHQIDIIIYDNTYPLLFKEGDFIIATTANVLGIIEVKSSIKSSQIKGVIEKANENGKIIASGTDKMIFNGIFSYNAHELDRAYIDNLKKIKYSDVITRQYFNQVISDRLYSCVNHIALGTEKFIKLWPVGNANEDPCISANYSMYRFEEGLAFSYFISNLQEIIIRNKSLEYTDDLPPEIQSFLYPIAEGKERRLLGKVYLCDNRVKWGETC